MLRLSAPLFVLLLALTACTGDRTPVDDEAADEPMTAVQPEPEEAAETEEPPRRCRIDDLEDAEVVELAEDDPVVLSHELARRTHRCVDVAVVAADDAWSSALSVSIAADVDAPLLLAAADDRSATGRVLDTLEPSSVVWVGLPADRVEAPSAGDTVELAADDEVGLALAVLDHLDARRAYAVAAGDRASRLAAIARNGGETPLLPIPEDDDELAELAAQLPATLRVEVVAADDDQAAALADRLTEVGVDAEAADGPRWEPAEGAGTLWLFDPTREVAAATVAATIAGRGEVMLPIDSEDLRAGPVRTSRLVDASPSRTVLVGEVTDGAAWQLPLLLGGPRLPTGGLLLFEDHRMVALYGTPSSTVLGVLGEQQDLDATVERAREVAEPYGADGVEVLPAFEMIVTIASAEAGERGDYSRRLDPDSFRPWIDRAAEEGFYVVLDLQPGRTDFLEQAQEYEELLVEPHVGLALDPEWRLEDDQVHLRQIGNVAAEEVQGVVDWLAALTREHALPQKLLVLHQFRHSMLPDRDTIEVPPELAVVVHMDGQGPIGTKYETYGSLTAGAEDRWLWGWKNFYDEDQPTPTPEQVLDLDPLPVFVSYQ